MTLKEFWPYYLDQHKKPATRYLHYVGTLLALICIAVALITWSWRWLIAAPLLAYGLAWLSHAFIEHNKPATFKHPWLSLCCDFIMLWRWLSGRLR